MTTTYTASGNSLDGSTHYMWTGEAENPEDAALELRAQVVSEVRTGFGITPEGVTHLVDPRTIHVTEEAAHRAAVQDEYEAAARIYRWSHQDPE